MSVHQDDSCAVGVQESVETTPRAEDYWTIEHGQLEVILPQLSAAHRSVRESNELWDRKWPTRHAEIIVSELGLTSEKTNLGICVKNLARRTQQPRGTDMQRLERLGRYLWRKQRVVQRFDETSGSYWAACENSC